MYLFFLLIVRFFSRIEDWFILLIDEVCFFVLFVGLLSGKLKVGVLGSSLLGFERINRRGLVGCS